MDKQIYYHPLMDLQHAHDILHRTFNKFQHQSQVQTEYIDDSGLEKVECLMNLLQDSMFQRLFHLSNSLHQLDSFADSLGPDDEVHFTRNGSLLLSTLRPPPIEDRMAEQKKSSLEEEAHLSTEHEIRVPSEAEFDSSIQQMAHGRPVHEVILTRDLPGESLGFSVVGLRGVGRDNQVAVFISAIVPGSKAQLHGGVNKDDQVLAIDGVPLQGPMCHEDAVALLDASKRRLALRLVLCRELPSTKSLSRHTSSAQNLANTKLPPASAEGFREDTGSLMSGDEHSEISEEMFVGNELNASLGSFGMLAATLPARGGGAMQMQQMGSMEDDWPGMSLAATGTGSGGNLFASTESVLDTEWTQYEVIDLRNDGSGLGFGIVGSKGGSVVVRSILHGGAADRDGRLQAGDHIFYIDSVLVRSLSSDQVAAMLRATQGSVRLIVARPFDADEFEVEQRRATQRRRGSSAASGLRTMVATEQLEAQLRLLVEQLYGSVTDPTGHEQDEEGRNTPVNQVNGEDSDWSSDSEEVEFFDVTLYKSILGLGLDLVAFKEEIPSARGPVNINGIFVRRISLGSAAALDGNLRINDKIVQVDGTYLHGGDDLNLALDLLRSMAQKVQLKVMRYLGGPVRRFLDQLDTDENVEKMEEKHVMLSQQTPQENNVREASLTLEDLAVDPYHEGHFAGPLDAGSKEAILHYWEEELGADKYEIVVAQVSRPTTDSSWGLSLEGTVQVDSSTGEESHPRHFIRAVIESGPVGRLGCLQRGDELLEVNNHATAGLSHPAVLQLLKEPQHIRLVCCRPKPVPVSASVTNLRSEETKGPSPTTLSRYSPAPFSEDELEGYLAHDIRGNIMEHFLEDKDALWSSREVEVMLYKNLEGLGFSLIEVETTDESRGSPETTPSGALVVRGVTPNSPASRVPLIQPGVRLLSINGRRITPHTPLTEAVHLLKSAPLGPVTLGIVSPVRFRPSWATMDTEDVEEHHTPTPPHSAWWDANEHQFQEGENDIDNHAPLEDTQSTIRDPNQWQLFPVDDDEEATLHQSQNAWPLILVEDTENKPSGGFVSSNPFDDSLFEFVLVSRPLSTVQENDESPDHMMMEHAICCGTFNLERDIRNSVKILLHVVECTFSVECEWTADLEDFMLEQIHNEMYDETEWKYAVTVNASAIIILTHPTQVHDVDSVRRLRLESVQMNQDPLSKYLMESLDEEIAALATQEHHIPTAPLSTEELLSLLPPLPEALEQRVKLRKLSGEALGCVLQEEGASLNGYRVLSISRDSPLDRDARVGKDDFITRVNGESLRSTSVAQMRDIFRRAALLSGELTMYYIPSIDAEVHIQSAILVARESGQLKDYMIAREMSC